MIENDTMIRIVKVHTLYDDVVLPEYATDQAACFDIRGYFPLGSRCNLYHGHANTIVSSNIRDSIGIELWSGETVLIPTGMIFDIEDGYSMRLHSRSGLSLKSGLILANGEGVIDSDYTKELFIMIRNASKHIKFIKHGERIAQGEMVKVNQVHFESMDSPPLQKTNRVGGFGSTGTH